MINEEKIFPDKKFVLYTQIHTSVSEMHISYQLLSFVCTCGIYLNNTHEFRMILTNDTIYEMIVVGGEVCVCVYMMKHKL